MTWYGSANESILGSWNFHHKEDKVGAFVFFISLLTVESWGLSSLTESALNSFDNPAGTGRFYPLSSWNFAILCSHYKDISS